MILDAQTVQAYLQADEYQLKRLHQEPPDGDHFLEEADQFYARAQEHLTNNNLLCAYECHLYLESYIGVKLEEVCRNHKLHQALEEFLEALPI